MDRFNIVLGGVVVIKVTLAVSAVAHENGPFIGDLADICARPPLRPFAAAVWREQRIQCLDDFGVLLVEHPG